jgi:hypothetical protein
MPHLLDDLLHRSRESGMASQSDFIETTYRTGTVITRLTLGRCDMPGMGTTG